MLIHINGNKLDNRSVNLRICDHAENMANCKLNVRSKTGITGVRWDKDRGMWAAQISVRNRMIALGRFSTLEAAAEARRTAEAKYHGEFAGTKGAQRG